MSLLKTEEGTEDHRGSSLLRRGLPQEGVVHSVVGLLQPLRGVHRGTPTYHAPRHRDSPPRRGISGVGST